MSDQSATAATHDPWHGRNPWGCCQDRNTHGGPGCKWPGTETEPLTAPATAATHNLVHGSDVIKVTTPATAVCPVCGHTCGHQVDCDCKVDNTDR